MEALAVGAVVVLSLGVGAWLAARSSRRRGTSAPRFVAPIALDDQRAVADLAREDRLVEATKVLRQRYALSLTDAVAAARALGAGEPVPSTWAMVTEALDPVVLEEVRDLVGSGQQIQAIHVVRRQTGLGLVEARKLVLLIEGTPPSGEGE